MTHDDSTKTLAVPSPVAVTPARRALPVAARPSAVASLTRGVQAIVPYSRYTAQRLGKLGILGVALLIFSAVAFVSTNLPMREQLATDSVTLTDLSTNAVGATQASVATTPEAQLEGFLDTLPTPDDLPSIMTKIVATSESAGIDLDEGSYELAAVGKSGQIERYRLQLPVVGTYPQVRAFVDNALVNVPSMALNGMTLQRNEIADRVISADLEFDVFVKAGP
jgi:Tfp pilus assembly protein PilO